MIPSELKAFAEKICDYPFEDKDLLNQLSPWTKEEVALALCAEAQKKQELREHLIPFVVPSLRDDTLFSEVLLLATPSTTESAALYLAALPRVMRFWSTLADKWYAIALRAFEESPKERAFLDIGGQLLWKSLEGSGLGYNRFLWMMAHLGVSHGLSCLHRSEAFPERYEIFLREALHRGFGPRKRALHENYEFSPWLVQIIEALPPERRDRVLRQDGPYTPFLAWEVATQTKSASPRLAELAAWKLADLGNRRNGGGTSTGPSLFEYELALFPVLGAFAVEPLVRELANKGRAEFLLKALGATRCVEALAPLCQIAAKGAKTHQIMAVDALREVLRFAPYEASIDALVAILREKRSPARLGAAEALGVVRPGVYLHQKMQGLLSEETDKTALVFLRRALAAQEVDAAQALWWSLKSKHEARAQQMLDEEYQKNESIWKYPLKERLAASSDELRFVALCVMYRHGPVFSLPYDGASIASGWMSELPLAEEHRELLPWALLEWFDLCRYDWHVKDMVELCNREAKSFARRALLWAASGRSSYQKMLLDALAPLTEEEREKVQTPIVEKTKRAKR